MSADVVMPFESLEDRAMYFDQCFKVLQTFPVIENDDSEPVSQCRNVFTVSYASKASRWNDQEVVSPAREDMLEQELAVRAHRAGLHEAFVSKHEAAAALSPAAKEVGLKLLAHEAAVRDVSLARQEGYVPEVVAFMRQTWQTFLAQVAAFFAADGQGALTATERNNSAVESISSIGIWFRGARISLPLRCYTVPVIGADGTPQLAVVVGLVSFCYSSYVMQTRAATQQAALCELARLRDELGTACYFVPQRLLVTQ